jgi:hypothetical protein
MGNPHLATRRLACDPPPEEMGMIRERLGLALAVCTVIAATPAVASAQACPADRSPRYREVHDLIARLGTVRGAAQQRVFDRLVSLGKTAVPAIIAQMDDRRPLLDEAMTLKNESPDAFEAIRQYGPERVVDALSAILNQITGEDFGSIENGGSDSDRATVVAGWRAYAARIGCSPQ